VRGAIAPGACSGFVRVESLAAASADDLVTNIAGLAGTLGAGNDDISPRPAEIRRRLLERQPADLVKLNISGPRFLSANPVPHVVKYQRLSLTRWTNPQREPGFSCTDKVRWAALRSGSSTTFRGQSNASRP